MLWHSWHVECTLKKNEFWKNSVEKEAKQPQDQGIVEPTVTVGAPRLLALIAGRTFCSQQSFVVEGIMKDFCFLFLGPHSSPLSSNTYIRVAFASFPKSHCRFATFCCCCQVASVMPSSATAHRRTLPSHKRQPTRFLCPRNSPGKNAGVGCHFLLQCMKEKSKSEVAQLCLTLHDPMDCSLSGSSVHGIFQARVLEWVAISFSRATLWV